MTGHSGRHASIADIDRAVLLVIDMQESYQGKLHEEQRVVTAIQRLLEASEILQIPVLLTEQYPERLGATRAEIAEKLPGDTKLFPKRTFSCLGAEPLATELHGLGRDQVIIAGIETHVCVSQTVHDLLLANYSVHLPADAVTARFPLEHHTAYQKMTLGGAIPTSVEALLFELLKDSRAPEFKSIHKLVV